MVAHNAPFDCSVLNKTLATYDLATPSFMVLDTVKTSKQFYQDLPDHKLNTVCDSLGIDLKHHHNALLIVMLVLRSYYTKLKEFGPTKLKPFVRQYNK